MERKILLLVMVVFSRLLILGQPIGTEIEQQYVPYNRLSILDTNYVFCEKGSSPLYFKFENITSDFGPLITSGYDFHGGADLSRRNASYGDAIVALHNGIVTRISSKNGVKSIIIKDSLYVYGYRHLFTGLDDNTYNLPVVSGNFVLGYEYGRYFILNLLNGIVLCKDKDLIISYNDKEYITTNIVKKGQLIAPIGDSGGYPTHLHLEFLNNLSNTFNDKNALNPLYYLDYDKSFYSRYIIYPQYKFLNFRKFKKIMKNKVLGVDDYIASMFDVFIDGSGSGYSYKNSLMDINEVKMEIASINDLNFKTIIGNNGELRISYGGIPEQPDPYPSYIVDKNTGQGSWYKTGVEPLAYNNHRSEDKFYFYRFTPALSNDGGLARYAGEVLYPDGDYLLRGKMTTVKGFSKTTANYPIKIDNFNPYIVYCDVTYNGIGSNRKELFDVGNKLEYRETGSSQFFTSNGVLSLAVKTSEPLQSLSVGIEDITVNDLQLFNLDGDRKFWMIFDIGISNVSMEDKQLIFHGKDMNGNDLVIHPDADNFVGHVRNGYLNSLYRNFIGIFSKKFKNTGYDLNYSVKFNSQGTSSVTIDDRYIYDYNGGNCNGVIEAEESIDLQIGLKNDGEIKLTNVSAVLSTDNQYVDITDSFEVWDNIDLDEIKLNNGYFNFYVPYNFSGRAIQFTLDINSDQGSWYQTFNVFVSINIDLELDSYYVYDGVDGDGLINKGEDIKIYFKMKNFGYDIATSPSILSNLYDYTYVSLSNSYTNFDDIPPGESYWDTEPPIELIIDENYPYDEITIHLWLLSDVYKKILDLTLPVYESDNLSEPDLIYAGFHIHDGIGGGIGNHSGTAQVGESIDLDVRMENIGDGEATNLEAYLYVNDGNIHITDNHEFWGDISPGDQVWCNGDFDFDIDDNFDGGMVTFSLDVYADGYNTYIPFDMYISQKVYPNLDVCGFHINDGIGGGIGNNNNMADAGESIDLDLRFENNGNGKAADVEAYLSSTDQYIDITDSYEVWDDISTNDCGWSNGDFDFDIDDNLPEKDVYFRVDIDAYDYSKIRYFYIHMFGGGKSVDDITFIDESELELRYKPFVSPNPINNSLLNIFLRDKSDLIINLYDINGVLIQNIFSGKIDIGFQSIPLKIRKKISSGVYILSIENKTNRKNNFVRILKIK